MARALQLTPLKRETELGALMEVFDFVAGVEITRDDNTICSHKTVTWSHLKNECQKLYIMCNYVSCFPVFVCT